MYNVAEFGTRAVVITTFDQVPIKNKVVMPMAIFTHCTIWNYFLSLKASSSATKYSDLTEIQVCLRLNAYLYHQQISQKCNFKGITLQSWPEQKLCYDQFTVFV